jgi:hypothetical protein
MTDQTTASVTEDSSKIAELTRQLQSSSEKKQLQLIPELVSTGAAGLEVLMEFLKEQQSTPADLIAGLAYQALYDADTPNTKEFLQTISPLASCPCALKAVLTTQPCNSCSSSKTFLPLTVLPWKNSVS